MNPNKFKDRTVIRLINSVSPGTRLVVERNGEQIGQGEWVKDEDTRDWLLVLPKEKGPSVLQQIREEVARLKHRDVNACLNFLNKLESSLRQIPGTTKDDYDYSGSVSINRDKIEIIFNNDTNSRALTLMFGVVCGGVYLSYVDEYDNRLSPTVYMFQACGATAILISALTS